MKLQNNSMVVSYYQNKTNWATFKCPWLYLFNVIAKKSQDLFSVCSGLNDKPNSLLAYCVFLFYVCSFFNNSVLSRILREIVS